MNSPCLSEEDGHLLIYSQRNSKLRKKLLQVVFQWHRLKYHLIKNREILALGWGADYGLCRYFSLCESCLLEVKAVKLMEYIDEL